MFFGAASPPPSPGNRSCPPFPAFPDSSCTGVPAGYQLSAVGSVTSSGAGQVIDGKAVSGDINIEDDNVTVSNSRIKGRVYLNNHTGIILKDVDIGLDACPSAGNGGYRLVVGDNGYTLIRAHLHHNADDMLSAGGPAPIVIRDSIVEKPCFYAGDHLDAIQFYDPGATGNVSVTHSIFDVRPINSTDKGNAAFFWADGPQGTLLIENSLLAGGGYTVQLREIDGYTAIVRNNYFVRDSYTWGTHVILDGDTSRVTWTNNVFSDNLQPVDK